MPDASVQCSPMVNIYAIMSGQLCLYVGKTTLTLRVRKRQHRSRSNTAGSKDIPSDFEWEMCLLEECPISQTCEREYYWWKKLVPLYNNNVPGGG